MTTQPTVARVSGTKQWCSQVTWHINPGGAGWAFLLGPPLVSSGFAEKERHQELSFSLSSATIF